MSKATDQVRKDWARLGDSDPLWAVLVRPGKKNGGWDERQFLDTGREEVEESLAHLAVLGVRLETGSAIDFGCGAGRLRSPSPSAWTAWSASSVGGHARQGASAGHDGWPVHLRAEPARRPLDVRRRQLRPGLLQPRPAAPPAGLGPGNPR